LSDNTFTDHCYPSPLRVLLTLGVLANGDCGRLIFASPETLLLPFLRAINQPPIDTKSAFIVGEDEVYTEVVLTQTLKEGVDALIDGNDDKYDEIDASLKTSSYKAFCDEKITIPDFHWALQLCSDVVHCDKCENSTTLTLKPYTKEDQRLFEYGLNLNTPGKKLIQCDSLTYKLVDSDNDVTYPFEVSKRIFLSLSNFAQILNIDVYSDDIKQPGDNIHVMPVSADNFREWASDVVFNNDGLAGLIESLLRKEDVVGVVISLGEEGNEHYLQTYGYDSEESVGEYLVLIFEHPFFPNEEFHVVLGATYSDSGIKSPTTVLKRPCRNYDDVSDFLVKPEDLCKKAEIPLLDALHFMLSATNLPQIYFE